MFVILALGVLPAGAHRHGVFSNGDTDAQSWAEFHPDGLDGIVKIGVFAIFSSGDHPVGRELDVADLADVGRGDIGQALADRDTAGCGGVEHRDRCTLADGHGFTGVNIHAGCGHGDVGDGCLPRADHLIAGDHASDAAVGDGDEEVLTGDGREAQHAVDRVGQLDGCGVEFGVFFDQAGTVFEYLRGLAEEDSHFHVDRVVLEVGVFEHELVVVGRFADDGDGAALTFAERFEGFDAVGHDGHDVALLGFVAPDLHGAHGGVFVVNVAQVEASSGGFDEFGQAVGKSASADVVNGKHGVVRAEGDATVDHLLTTAFHFWVAALDGVKVEGFGLGACADRGGCTAAEADLHRGAAELKNECSRWNGLFVDVLALHVAHTAGDHDWLVIAAVLTVVLKL